MACSLDFFHLNEVFLNLGAIKTPGELQGMLCGRLCGGKLLSEDTWWDTACSYLEIGATPLDTEQRLLIEQFYRDTCRLLKDVNYSFVPLLPGEESSITRRTEELALWCQGFLHGIATSGLRGDSQFSPDAADALRDLAQISQAGLGDEDELEENEAHWHELVEYLKVAVLTIYTDRPESPLDAQSQVMH